MKHILYISLFFLVACFQADDKLNPIPSNTLSIAPDINQNKVVHVDLRSLSLHHSENPANWHLKFSTDPENWYIYLNGLEDVAVYKTSTTEFNEIDSLFTLTGLNWKVDIPTSSGFTPAIGEWGDFDFSVPQSFNEVFVLRLRDSIVARFVKLQILNAVEGGYKIRYGSLDGDFENTVLIPKNSDYNFTYLALEEVAAFRLVEPKKSEWAFSYTFIPDSIEFSSSIPYASTLDPYLGIYPALQINTENTTIHIEKSIAFEDVNFFNVKDLEFQPIDHIKNFFIAWDSQNMEADIQENTTLIVKQNNSYFAIRPVQTSGEYPEKFALDLLVKKL